MAQFLQSPTKFDAVIDRLESGAGPDHLLDRTIYRLVTEDELIRQRLRGILGPTTPAFTAGLDALALIPTTWWWHCSHLEAVVIPTDGGAPVSNGADYIDRRPVEYHSMLFDRAQRVMVPRGIAAAALRAHRALFMKQLAIETGRMYLMQTGSGPKLVSAEGRVVELPYHMWLNEAGELVPKEQVIPNAPRESSC